MRRFLIDPLKISGERIQLDRSEAHHLRNVLRLTPGEEVVLVTGQGEEYLTRLVALHSEGAELCLLANRPGLMESPLRLILGLSLLKADRMDLVVQKATELGLSKLIPLICRRSIVRLEPDRRESRLNRWRGISHQALKQCHRSQALDIGPIMDLNDFCRLSDRADLKLMFHPGRRDIETSSWNEIQSSRPKPKEVWALIGPEGGFALEELNLTIDSGFKVLALGPRVLKSETAALAVISVFEYLWGDLSHFT